MTSYTDALIASGSNSSAKTKQKKKVIRAMVLEKIGYRAPNCLGIKQLQEILDQ